MKIYDSLKQVLTFYITKDGTCSISFATLIGCSDGNTQSELPKQTNQTKQETTGNDSFAKLEKEFDAKPRYLCIDTDTNQTVTYQSDKRFAYASTHKALAVGVLLQKKSIEDLNQKSFVYS